MNLTITTTGLESSNVLLQELEKLYGKPQEEIDYQGKKTWKGRKVCMIYNFDSKTSDANAFMYSLEITDRRKSEKAGNNSKFVKSYESQETQNDINSIKVKEIQTEDKNIIIGRLNKLVIYIHVHKNFTTLDSIYTFFIADNEYFLTTGGLDKNNAILLLNTALKLKDKLNEQKIHETEVTINEDNQIHATARYKMSTGKWEARLYSNYYTSFEVTIIELDKLIPLIEKAIEKMPSS